MININGKVWQDLTGTDIEAFLALPETEESFFFEFKDDRVDSKKLAEEITAFANTYGGYIILGVSNDKTILGCSGWNEQRIFTTIHDSVTPTPSFDIKKLICHSNTVYVIRIDEGSEPPYITSQGKILERIASGSCIIKDSTRLSQLYYRHERQLKRVEEQITIPPVHTTVNNIFGYIDIGFKLTLSDRTKAVGVFFKSDLEKIINEELAASPSFNLIHIGNSFVYSPGDISPITNKLPANANNFVEIMCDGSARMRVLLANNDPEDTSVSLVSPFLNICSFRACYRSVFSSLFPDSFIFAKKYEALTVLKQFQPHGLYDPDMIQGKPELAKKNEEHRQQLLNKRAILGVDNVITSDRIPKAGLNTVDRQFMQRCGIKEYTAESIINELFYSQYAEMCFPIAEGETEDR